MLDHMHPFLNLEYTYAHLWNCVPALGTLSIVPNRQIDQQWRLLKGDK